MLAINTILPPPPHCTMCRATGLAHVEMPVQRALHDPVKKLRVVFEKRRPLGIGGVADEGVDAVAGAWSVRATTSSQPGRLKTSPSTIEALRPSLDLRGGGFKGIEKLTPGH